MPPPRTPTGGHFAAATLALLLGGCATVSPRFSQEVAASFARDEMRKLETPLAEIYYPAQQKAAAERIALRMQQCLSALRQYPKTRKDRGKALVYLTSANFNNAYVTGMSFGEPLHTVEPLHMTLELFHWFNLGAADVGDVACHELVHYVQLEQADGLWGALNWFFGNLLPPNGLTESWFLEGLAQYYEGRLGRSLGRPNSAFYRGNFESGIAARGGVVSPGDLNSLERELYPFSGAYLAGMHFVEYLAQTYGEEKLWELVDLQGHSVFSPFIVTLRFKSVYGKSVGALVEDYSKQQQLALRLRHRPDSQRVLAPDLGYIARLAGSTADGATAVLSAGRDQVVQLAVHERDGALRFSRSLTQLAPGRRWISVSPLQVSGMSFTADGRWLYLMNDDYNIDGASEAQLWKVDARDGEVVQLWEGLPGFGGAVSPDGTRYLMVEVAGDTSNLVEVNLATGTRAQVTHLTGQVTLASPSYSPDGARIAFSRFGVEGFDLWLREADGRISQLTHDEAFNYAPRWMDGGNLLFVREREGRVQAHSFELATGAVTPVSNAPYVVLDPVPIGLGDFAFVNRDGWNWSLDAAPIAAVAEATAAAEAAPQAAAADTTATLQVESDRPYSTFDHLFVPGLHSVLVVPSAAFEGSTTRWGARVVAMLRGQDRLGFHQWALNADVDTLGSTTAFAFEYGNQLLAPWFTKLHLERDSHPSQTTLLGSLSTSRSLWTTPVSLSVTGIDLDLPATADEEARHTRLLGPGVAFDYFAAEGTAYGGTKRALGLAGGVNFYPAFLGSDFGMADVNAQVTLAPHLPLLARHSLVATVRGRSLWGAPQGLLQVGGIAHGDLLTAAGGDFGGPTTDLLPGVGFAEPVRGYEDAWVRATAVAIGTARYRYPFIIDHGWASTFYVLPAFFLRQVDVEAFGSAAYTDNPQASTLRAAGGAIFVRSAISYVPFSLYYQVAARFDQGLPVLHLFGLALE